MRTVPILLSLLLASAAHAAEVKTPAEIYGELFERVQMERVYPDGKNFVDALPLKAPDQVLADYRAASDFMAAQYPDLELWAGGFSFGSYISMTAGADDDRICTLIGIAPPVDRYEFASVKLSTKPKFIIHGERDELISLKAVREFYARLQEPKELVEIDRANHLFDGQASEVGDALEELLSDYSCKTL